jgi:antitoxin ParD1/3/4
MSKNTSITLGSYFDQFIQNLLREGRYKNASEVVRAGLRLLEEEEQKIIALRRAIDEGINSGLVENFDPKEHLEAIHKKYK